MTSPGATGSTEDISSIATHTLDLPPSCVEFCPAFPTYFVVGTYNLDQATTVEPRDGEAKRQNRNGSLVAYRVEARELVKVQTLSQPSAQLDLHFHPSSELNSHFATVSSTATLCIFKLDPGTAPAPVGQLTTLSAGDVSSDVLFLSFAWHPSISSLVAVTTSTGQVKLMRLSDDFCAVRSVRDLEVGNSLEAWCVAFSPPREAIVGSTAMRLEDTEGRDVVYCGGDDSILRYAAVSTSDASDEASDEASIEQGIEDKKRHDAGVTYCLPLPISTADGRLLVITGSYDDHIRLFAVPDPRAYPPSTPGVRLLAQTFLGGGVWRLKLLEAVAEKDDAGEDVWRARILASCMHAGCRVLEYRSGSDEFAVLGRFEEHGSMNYGSDAVVVSGPERRLRCVSTSFYDRLLCLWETED